MKYPPAEIMVLCRLDPHLGCRHHDFGHSPHPRVEKGKQKSAYREDDPFAPNSNVSAGS